MRIIVRMVLAAALLASASLAFIGAPVLATNAPAQVTVTCSNGFTRTVSAYAATGIAKSLTKFNAYNQSGVTCAAGAGALAPAPAVSWLYIDCSNGFVKRVSSHAAGGITKALNAFDTRSHTGVTCAVRA